jgi:hypothetical protein
MMQNYNSLLDRISRASGMPIADIERRIEAKRAKLSGLISKEGAAQIVASELGISLENEKLKISELVDGMRRANVLGQIIELHPVRTYNKNNRSGKVGSFMLADETSNIKAVLWDLNHIKLIEDGILKEGSIVEIKGGNIRNFELHLTGFSEIKPSTEFIENVKTEREYNQKKILDLRVNDNALVRAFVVQIFEPRFFEVCPECKSRAIASNEGYSCQKHGKIIPLKRFLLNLVIDDGTETMRMVLFNEQAEKLFPNTDLANVEQFLVKRDEILGKEFLFSGNVRKNKFFNNEEFFVSDIKEIEADKLIEELEKTN